MIDTRIEPDPATTGVMIVDHGSRRREANQMLDDFVDMFRAASHYRIVEPAHMDLAEPSIATAFGRCVRHGAACIVVSPYFLSPGRHWHENIPDLTARAAGAHPGVPFIVAAPIGLHPMMVELIQSRIDRCLARSAGNARPCDACADTGRCVMQQADS